MGLPSIPNLKHIHIIGSATLGLALDSCHFVEDVHHGAVKAWKSAIIAFVSATGTSFAVATNVSTSSFSTEPLHLNLLRSVK